MTEDRCGGEARRGALLSPADPGEDRLRIRSARELDALPSQVLREAQLGYADHADIPVIVVTAAGALARPIDARRIQGKPFPLDELFRAIDSVS